MMVSVLVWCGEWLKVIHGRRRERSLRSIGLDESGDVESSAVSVEFFLGED